MLVTREGRTVSVRTASELDESLKKEMSTLTPEEREALRIILQDFHLPTPIGSAATQFQPAQPNLLAALSAAEYKTQPVDMRTFIKDTNFLGNTCDSLYPKFLDDLVDLFSGGYNECIITGAIGIGKCLGGDTEIYDTSTGRRRLVREAGSLSVPSKTDSHRFEPRAATAFASGQKPCVRISLQGGQALVLSTDHRVFTDRGWVEAAALTSTDLIATPRKLPPPLRAEAYSDESVKLVAYLLSDGGTTTSNTTFTNETPAILAEFKALVESEGDCSTYNNWHKNDVPGVHELAPSGAATMFSCTGITHKVRDWQIGGHARDKRIPAGFYGLPDAQIALFLNRFWACDGCVGRPSLPQLEVCLASEGLVDDLRHLLLRLGIQARKKFKWASYISKVDGTRRTFPAWRLFVTGSTEVARFFETVGPVIGKEEMSRRVHEACLTLKSNPNVDLVPVGLSQLKEIRSEMGLRGKGLLRRFGCVDGSLLSRQRFQKLCLTEGYSGKYAWLADNEILWDRVASSEDVGILPVFDLSVPGTHNLIANQIVVHNTFVCTIGIARVLYEISCLKDPHKTFGLAKDTNITLACFSVNEELATKVVFENIKTKITASPYFMQNFPFSATKKELRFPHNVWVAPRATTDTSALGLNVISAFMDEGNFLPKRGKYSAAAGVVDHADLIYSSLKRRMKSRFEKAGKLPGILFIASSKTTHEDFVSRRLKEARDDPTLFVRDYALWEIKPEDYYSVDKFHVLVGNETIPSKILDPGEADRIRPSLPDGTLIIGVPEDFKLDFERDLEGCFTGDTTVSLLDGREVALQDLQGEDSFWVYSFGPDGRMYPGRGHSARQTHADAEIVEVELDNGEKIRCTPNHRFMLRDGTYKEARDLAAGTSLMPLYRRKDRHGYEMLKSNMGGRWVHTHRLVAREAYRSGARLGETEVVHHVDFHSTNNTPENLQVMEDQDHYALHTARLPLTLHRPDVWAKSATTRREKYKTDPAYQAQMLGKVSSMHAAYSGTDEHRATAQRVGLTYGFGRDVPTDAQRQAQRDNGTKNITALNASDRNPSKKPENRAAAGSRLRAVDPAILAAGRQKGLHSRYHEGMFETCALCRGEAAPSPATVRSRHQRKHTGKYRDCLICNPPNNHKVVAVRPAGRAPVFDITVDTHHNFSLTAGVVVHNSIKDIAGCSVVSVSPFIQRREKLVDAVEQDKKTYGADRHFFSKPEYDPSKGGQFVWEKAVRLTPDPSMRGQTDMMRPIINPNAMRHVHIDIGLRHDALGLCMAHIGSFRDVVRRGPNGEQHLERAPVFVVDLMLRVTPPPGDEIILGDVRRLIYELAQHGYTITSVTTDSYQSTDLVQQLNQKGFNAKIVSVDTSTEPYEALKTAFYEDRVFMYEHGTLLTELRQLQRDYRRRKIDHPSRGSKDCADALAGVLWTLGQQQLTTPLPILRQSATGGDSWMTDQYQGQVGGGPAGAGAERWEPLPFFRGSSTGGRG
jgi:intein/homing endonuclease